MKKTLMWAATIVIVAILVINLVGVPPGLEQIFYRLSSSLNSQGGYGDGQDEFGGNQYDDGQYDGRYPYDGDNEFNEGGPYRGAPRNWNNGRQRSPSEPRCRGGTCGG